MILLTSFNTSRNILKRQSFVNSGVNTYSVSRKQPSGFNYTDLPFLAAIDKHGTKLSLSDGITVYYETLMEYYKTVYESDILPWMEDLSNDNVDILCCWCPYSISTKRQMNSYQSFVCHTGIIGQMVNEVRPDIDVYMDIDRHNHLISEYKPPRYKPFIL